MSVCKVQRLREVLSHEDGTFSISGDSFVSSDFLLARAVAKELDRIDPYYVYVDEDSLDARRPREKCLSQLRVGDKAWTVPWAMWQDLNRCYWLHPDSPAEVAPGGTISMTVECVCGRVTR